MKARAKTEYDLIMAVTQDGYMPSADMIETISYSSLNPMFRSIEFRKALIAYRTKKNFGGVRRNATEERLEEVREMNEKWLMKRIRH